MRLSEFDFELPEALIAQAPLAERSASRLLDCLDTSPVDRWVAQLPQLLRAGDLVIFNDTRVIKARMTAVKETGGRVELLIERVTGTHTALAQMRASHAAKPGSRILVDGLAGARVLEREGDLFTLCFDQPIDDVLSAHGHLPLPPYITHEPTRIDEERYQTVFAHIEGAVAAPTAGLHFDAPLITALEKSGVQTQTITLHVGAGTFQPVRVDDLAEHVMHAERFDVTQPVVDAVKSARARGGRVVAIGTTTLRALESSVDAAGQLVAQQSETRLFVTPGFNFQVVDVLMTNFHLPRSTLLMLVSAFAGVARIRNAYEHAIAQQYRFFSYGDAMLLARS